MAREHRWAVGLAAAAMLLFGAASASAAPRYASPAGVGVNPCADMNNPCPIETAVNMAGMGDDVTLLGYPTQYVTSTPLTIGNGVVVHGQNAAERPVIRSTSIGIPGITLGFGATLEGVVLEYSGINAAAILLSGGGFLDRVTSHVVDEPSSTAGAACEASGASGQPIIRASVCWYDADDSANGAAIAAFAAPGVVQVVTLQGVTAVSTTAEAAIDATNSAGDVTIYGRNVLAQSDDGGEDDLRAVPGGVTGAIDLFLDYSNYDSAFDSDGVGNQVSVTAPGFGTNELTPPVFFNYAGGDFRQSGASAGTVDHGVDGSIQGIDVGMFDFEGETRNQSANPPLLPTPDIGADELTPRTLTVDLQGTGGGTLTGPGLSCTTDCMKNYALNEEVPLQVTPAPGSTFAGWGGSECSGMALACSVLLDGAMGETVIATFDGPPAPPPPGGGGGGGTVTPLATPPATTPATAKKKCKKGRKLRRGRCVKKKKK